MLPRTNMSWLLAAAYVRAASLDIRFAILPKADVDFVPLVLL